MRLVVQEVILSAGTMVDNTNDKQQAISESTAS